MRNRKTQSALLLAGAAAGVAAAWLGQRRLRLVSGEPEPFVEPESAELPLGRSADPDIDEALSRQLLPQEDTTGATLLGEMGPESAPSDAELEEVWSAVPELAEPEQTEGYDAVRPEDLGSIWLERATQTTHQPHASVFESSISPETEGTLVSEASITSAQGIDEVDELESFDGAIGEGDLDEPDSRRREEPEDEPESDDAGESRHKS